MLRLTIQQPNQLIRMTSYIYLSIYTYQSIHLSIPHFFNGLIDLIIQDFLKTSQLVIQTTQLEVATNNHYTSFWQSELYFYPFFFYSLFEVIQV